MKKKLTQVIRKHIKKIMLENQAYEKFFSIAEELDKKLELILDPDNANEFDVTDGNEFRLKIKQEGNNYFILTENPAKVINGLFNSTNASSKNNSRTVSGAEELEALYNSVQDIQTQVLGIKEDDVKETIQTMLFDLTNKIQELQESS